MPSLKKLRITRLSRQVWITSLSLAGVAALYAGSSEAQQPGQRYLLTIEDNQPRIQLIEGVEQAQGSSLDRLKERSAQNRFEQIQKQRTASGQPEPLPLLEPAESTPIPVAPPAPVENMLPRLPDVTELERNDPFVREQQRLQNVTSGRAIPPNPAQNKLPQLPDLDDLEEFDPFVNSQKQLQNVPSQPNRIVRPVPAPEPAAIPNLRTPVYSALQDPATTEPASFVLPNIVPSLNEIQPTYEFQFTRKSDYTQEDTANIDPTRVPKLIPFPDQEYHERLSPDSLFAWEAANLFHNPLYFEDPTLERYGHVHPCIQPFVSLSRVGVQLVGLPYQTVIDTPWTERYTLGWYRPGEPAPHLFYQVPLNGEAALAEAAAITGAVLIVP